MMDAEVLKEKLSTLDSYHSWQAAMTEQHTAAYARPEKISLTDRSHLRSQVAFLDAQEEQLAARNGLMLEVTQQDASFLSLPHQLSVLAALKATRGYIAPEVRGDRILGLGLLIHAARMPQGEQQVFVASEPITRAVQIGTELERLYRLLDTRRRVPVALVWNHNDYIHRFEHDDVIVGHVSPGCEAFQLEPPKVNDVDGVISVDFTVPTKLEGVKKDKVVAPNDYEPPESKYTNPAIPVLRQLVGLTQGYDGPDALYVGRREVDARVSQAKADLRSYQSRFTTNSEPWQTLRHIPDMVRRRLAGNVDGSTEEFDNEVIG